MPTLQRLFIHLFLLELDILYNCDSSVTSPPKMMQPVISGTKFEENNRRKHPHRMHVYWFPLPMHQIRE